MAVGAVITFVALYGVQVGRIDLAGIAGGALAYLLISGYVIGYSSWRIARHIARTPFYVMVALSIPGLFMLMAAGWHQHPIADNPTLFTLLGAGLGWLLVAVVVYVLIYAGTRPEHRDSPAALMSSLAVYPGTITVLLWCGWGSLNALRTTPGLASVGCWVTLWLLVAIGRRITLEGAREGLMPVTPVYDWSRGQPRH